MDDLTDDDIPSWRADPEIRRDESVKFSFMVKGPLMSGQMDYQRQGSDRSPTARATTVMIVVAVACVAAVTIAVICKLMAAPALLLGIGAIAAFAGVMITGTMISFPRGGRRSRREVISHHLTPFRPRLPEGNGTGQALSPGDHQNGHSPEAYHNGPEPKKRQKGAGRSGKPPRR